MLRKAALLAVVAGASAFSSTPSLAGLHAKPKACGVTMQADGSVSRREMLKTFVAGAALAAPALANAEIDYANVPFLGGSDKIDVNNANIRVYTKLPGMYPNIAGIIAKNGPYQTVEDIYKVPKLSAEQKEIIKKYEKNLVALDPAPEYQEDIFNNGLYR